MKKNFKNVCAKALSVALALGLVVSSAPASTADAAAKKPKLSKTKLTITKGSKKKVTVKNAKKVTWKLTKAGKKIVSLSKKSKKGATIKGKKVGKATITVKMVNGKKKVTKKLKVTVKAKGKTNTDTNKATDAPKVTNPPATQPTKAPTQPTQAPTQAPTAEPTPFVIPDDAYVAEWPEVTISEYNEYTSANDPGQYRSGIDWDEENHTVTFTSEKQYNGGVGLALNPENPDEGRDLSEFKYVRARFYSGTDTTATEGVDGDHTSEAMIKMYEKLNDLYNGTNAGYFYGEANIPSSEDQLVEWYLDISEEAESGLLTDVKSINVAPKNAGQTMTLVSVTFMKEKEDTGAGQLSVAIESSASSIKVGSDETATVKVTPTATNCAVSGVAWSVSDNGELVSAATEPGDDGSYTATVKAKGVGTIDVTAEVESTTGLKEKKSVKITAYKEETKAFDGTFDFSSENIIAGVNPYTAPYGDGDCKAEVTEDGLKLSGNNMTWINFSAYLLGANIKLSDYSKMIVDVEVYDRDGDLLVGDADEQRSEKCALMKNADPSSGLNGYGNSDLLDGQDYSLDKANEDYDGVYQATLDLTGLKANLTEDDLNAAAGLNIQLNHYSSKLKNSEDGVQDAEFGYILVKSIKLEK